MRNISTLVDIVIGNNLYREYIPHTLFSLLDCLSPGDQNMFLFLLAQSPKLDILLWLILFTPFQAATLHAMLRIAQEWPQRTRQGLPRQMAEMLEGAKAYIICKLFYNCMKSQMGKGLSKTAGLVCLGSKSIFQYVYIYIDIYIYTYVFCIRFLIEKTFHKQINKEILETGRISGSLKIQNPKSRLSKNQILESSRLGARS